MGQKISFLAKIPPLFQNFEFVLVSSNPFFHSGHFGISYDTITFGSDVPSPRKSQKTEKWVEKIGFLAKILPLFQKIQLFLASTDQSVYGGHFGISYDPIAFRSDEP